MSEITDLPEKVLCKILGYLDYGSMKQACLVCKDWNTIISNSKQFIDSTKIVIKFDQNSCDTTNLLKVERMSRISDCIEFVGVGKRSNALYSFPVISSKLLTEMFCKIIDGTSAAITCMSFKNFMWNDSFQLKQITQVCPNLKELEFEMIQCSFMWYTNRAQKLHKLTYNNCVYRYMIDVKHLDIFIHKSEKDTDPKLLVQFLNNIDTLDTLILQRCRFRFAYYEQNFLLPKFRWSHLKIIDPNFEKITDKFNGIGHWKKLINSAAAGAKLSLESDNSRQYLILFQSLLKTICGQKNITQMKIDYHHEQMIKMFDGPMKFDHIKTLKIRKSESFKELNERNLVALMTYFPNVDSLDIRLGHHGSLVKNRLQTFKNLKIGSLNEYPKLKRMMDFPEVETLEVTECKYSDLVDIDFFLSKLLELRRLIIHYKSSININMWMKCYAKFPSVQEFEIIKDSTGVQHVKTRTEVEGFLLENGMDCVALEELERSNYLWKMLGVTEDVDKYEETMICNIL